MSPRHLADVVVEMSGTSVHDAKTIAKGAEALLREHPDALVCGLASNGLIVPVPQSVGLWGQGLIEGRALIDNVVAGDRTAVVRLWLQAQEEGAASARVRMLNSPNTWSTLHFIDLRELHGVLLGVILPTGDDADDVPDDEPEAPAAPRFCTLTEDEGAKVLAADDAFTEMFGYTEAELLGKSVLDQIHPDDQGRAVEGWLAVLSTNRAQQTRLRRRRKDGSWMWVDTTLHNYLHHPDRNYVLVEIIDISAEMQAQEALEEREEILRRLTNAMPVGLLQLDTDRKVRYHNNRLVEILAGPGSDTRRKGDSARATKQGDDRLAMLLGTLTETSRAHLDEALTELLEEGVDRDIEVDLVLPSGEERQALMSLRALLRHSGEVSGAITCVLDVTDSARARKELERRATYDQLTGCHNRPSIVTALERELERRDSDGTAVVYVDLDQFKPVNDRLGHAAGDELLAMVARCISEASRDTDLVGRLGGDEFLIVLRDIPRSEVAMRVSKRIARALSRTFELSQGTVEIRASVGVACAFGEPVSADELTRRADEAMYQSKEQGRGQAALAA